MKKNVMMRIASVLLVAVLLTTCAISGTFAKYVTSDNGSDFARVAKFGVTVAISDHSNFGKTYVSTDGTYVGNAVNADVNVVAPGTNSEEVDNVVTFAITGTPEVATRIAIEFDVLHDIYLGAGTYCDPTTAATGDSFEEATDYYPVVFTLKNSANAVVATGNLTAIKTAFNALSADYAPGAVLNETYTLTWAWAFNAGKDAADTMLGNLAAGAGWNYTEVTNYSTELEYDLTITVTQID